MTVMVINDVQRRGGGAKRVASFQFLKREGEVFIGPNNLKKTVASLAYHLHFYIDTIIGILHHFQRSNNKYGNHQHRILRYFPLNHFQFDRKI